VKITSKGQVTIPIALRERFGLLPETEVDFEVAGDELRLRSAQRPKGGGRGAAVVARMLGKGDVRMTTDQILALTRGRPTPSK